MRQSVLVVSCVALAVTFSAFASFKYALLPMPIRPVAVAVNSAELLTPSSLVLGSPSAKGKLVMFGDYQCSPCKMEWADISRQFASNGTSFAVYFHNFPLTNIHPRAFEAATIAERAKVAGRFPEVHGKLYVSDIRDISLDTQLRKFRQVYREQDPLEFECKNKVLADMRLGDRLGVEGTPTMFWVDANGKVYRIQSLEQGLQL